MARTTRRLALALACSAAAGTALAALHTAPVLELSNAGRGRAVAFPIAPGEPFSVTYHHSMYEAPVTEHFAIGADGRIELRAVSSPSAAVREYFGITAAGESHAILRAMPEIVFRVATGTPQRLRVGDVERSFLALGEPGDRLVMRAAKRSAIGRALSAAEGSP